MKKVEEILDLPTFSGGAAFPETCGITLDHVSFSYDGKTDVLRDCSLTVAQGEKGLRWWGCPVQAKAP